MNGISEVDTYKIYRKKTQTEERALLSKRKYEKWLITLVPELRTQVDIVYADTIYERDSTKDIAGTLFTFNQSV